MKKLCILLCLLLFSTPVFADDETSQTAANQEIEASNNKAVVVIQKQPLNENSNQKIVLKKNWFVVFVQVNGKVKVYPASVEVE